MLNGYIFKFFFFPLEKKTNPKALRGGGDIGEKGGENEMHCPSYAKMAGKYRRQNNATTFLSDRKCNQTSFSLN